MFGLIANAFLANSIDKLILLRTNKLLLLYINAAKLFGSIDNHISADLFLFSDF